MISSWNELNKNVATCESHIKHTYWNISNERNYSFVSAHTFCFVILKGAIFSPSPQASNLKICQGFTIVKLKWTLPS